MHCSPSHSNNGHTCYTVKHLKDMARGINTTLPRSSKISLSLNKQNLWSSIREKLSDKCSDEWCWINHDKIKSTINTKVLKNVFRPIHPKGGSNVWLSTTDINSVMKQYEAIYPKFVFFGPVPIDFKQVSSEVGKINIKNLYRKGVRQIGLVFNTDPSHKSGKHWMSMFIDLHNYEVNYFDSNPKLIPKEINDLINTVVNQGKDKMNVDFKVNINNRQHQFGPSECGVYSIYFITESLKGRSFSNIVNNIVRDDEMNKNRVVFFRPHNGANN